MRTSRHFLSDIPAHFQRKTSVRNSYRPEIDGLRFFAIAMVIFGHLSERVQRFQADQFKDGDLTTRLFKIFCQPASGVYLFFAISGFIIYGQYIKKRSNPLRASFLKSYFSRRILRIEPPYMILITATYLAITFGHLVPAGANRFEAGPSNLTQSFVASLLYAHGWALGALPRLFGPGWSLEIEVQFYILAPLLFLGSFLLKTERLRQGWMLLLLALFFVSTGLGVYTNKTPFLQFTLLRFGLFFWIGVVICELQGQIRAAMRRVPTLIAEAAPWIAVAALFGADLLGGASGFSVAAIQTVSIFLIFAGALADQGGFKAFCSLPWISFIGGACYSIYLTHLQFLQVAVAILAHLFRGLPPLAMLPVACLLLIPPTLVGGLLFYILIERPFMFPDWPDRLARFLRLRRGQPYLKL